MIVDIADETQPEGRLEDLQTEVMLPENCAAVAGRHRRVPDATG